MIDSPDQVGTVLRKAFELPEPALFGIRVDHRTTAYCLSQRMIVTWFNRKGASLLTVS
jgi:hypothetical protein